MSSTPRFAAGSSSAVVGVEKPDVVGVTARPDVVYVADFSWWRHQSVCTCGWRGRRRLLVTIAKLDAYGHASATDHQPGVPLVIPALLRTEEGVAQP